MENLICDYYFFHGKLNSHRLCLNFDEKEKIKKNFILQRFEYLGWQPGNQFWKEKHQNESNQL